ncbi:MAG: hypothetical protein IT580_01805, partial [Verrucomicrobiales bacterium]|nr:hypothetical protein [Verrucomicrobiales bacterium]
MLSRSSPSIPRVRRGLVRLTLALGLAALATSTSGCRTYATKTQEVRSLWRAGQSEQAAKVFTERADAAPQGRDAVIWRLEQATALRAAGRFEESTRAFEAAEARMAEYGSKARVRVATEAMATMTTPANLPYEGRTYDRIMAATYRALNALTLGQPDSARPALIKAYQYQQDAVAENSRRIERAQNDARDSKDAGAISRTEGHPQFRSQVDSLYSKLAQLKPYSDYVIPFTVWLDGVFFLARAQDLSDLERAHKSLERALAFAPDHPGIQADLRLADARFKGAPLEPVTYVVFETGQAPIRAQVRFDIPIIFANVSYVGSAWPVLETQAGHALTLAVNAGGQRLTTTPGTSMDSVIARDFEDERPAIITRTLVSTLAKGAA